MFDLAKVQDAIQRQGLDGWLLYDFRLLNVLAARIAGTTEAHRSRRWAYFIPAQGEPRKLVHRIEPAALDHLPGEHKTQYLRWQEFEAGLRFAIDGAKRIAMEYAPRNGNPYISRVDGGTIELVRSFGVDIASSGDLIQEFEATWSWEQWASHLDADRRTVAAFGVAWQFIAEKVRDEGGTNELAVQQRILEHFAETGLITDHPPVVAEGPHSGDPHYSPTAETSRPIVPGSFVLIDLWAKMDRPNAVYSDLTRVGYVGQHPPADVMKVFKIVAAARDAAIAKVENAFAANEELCGWEVDAACREVIEKAGYGDFFTHRTGHNIGQETHGNGCHMDSLETREERRVLRRTCFSVEPGIYLPEFGVRSEVNVYVDENGKVHVTGGPPQTDIRRILA